LYEEGDLAQAQQKLKDVLKEENMEAIRRKFQYIGELIEDENLTLVKKELDEIMDRVEQANDPITTKKFAELNKVVGFMQALREESGSEASSDIDEIKANIKNEMKSMKIQMNQDSMSKKIEELLNFFRIRC